MGLMALAAAGCGSDISRTGPTECDSCNEDGGGGAAGSSGTSTSGSGTSTSSSGAGGSEDCLNGVDDDGDSLIDCQDLDCAAGFHCLPLESPDGWGYGWLRSLPADQCPAETPVSYELYDLGDLNAPPAACGCSCTSPTGVECVSALDCWTGQQCTGPAAHSFSIEPTCSLPGLVDLEFACTASPPSPEGGSCNPGSVVENVPPVSWPSTKSVCMVGPKVGVCSDTMACVPKLGDLKELCLVYSGNVGCPPGSDKELLYDGSITDTRGCSGCTCGQPSGGSCACSTNPCGVSLHTQNDCLGGLVTFVPANGSCIGGTHAEALLAAVMSPLQLVNSGSCPGVSTPTGSVAAEQGAITLCCGL